METQVNNAKLFGKIAQVMSKVRTLEKTGENKFDKYDYVTADAIATRVGAVLAEVGLAFFPSMISVETNEYTTQKGGTNFRTVAHFQMTLACTETGATYTSMWSGEAIDRSDKSISKAAVSAVKYFLLKTFLLAGDAEEDADASSPAIEGQRKAQSSTPPPQSATASQKSAIDGDVVFAAEPTPEELAIINQWSNRTEAEMWAVMIGACADETEARKSLDESIAKCGGKVTKATYICVYVDFLRRNYARVPA